MNNKTRSGERDQGQLKVFRKETGNGRVKKRMASRTKDGIQKRSHGQEDPPPKERLTKKEK